MGKGVRSCLRNFNPLIQRGFPRAPKKKVPDTFFELWGSVE